MKKEKPQIGIRSAKKGEDTKGLGIIKFGKCRQDKTKYVLVDIEYDEKAGKELFEIGMEMLAKDNEAVINYVIVEAIKNSEKPKCRK
ncbi:MAG: hypothetical protein EBR82_38490 [Caulobacteraceae bacterium]|nr:hypothetical protein [Caulobacteraceae bacterium]